MYGTLMIWLSSTIAKCWNAAAGVAAEVVLVAALGDLARRLLPDLAALVGEVERDVRCARAAGALVEVLLRVLDVRAAERGVVAQHVVGVVVAVADGVLSRP